MKAGIRLEAIKGPVKLIDTSKVKNDAEAAVRNFAADVSRQMQQYPTQQATKSGYIRSGDYGRNWNIVKIVNGYAIVNAVRRSESRYRVTRKDGSTTVVTRRHRARGYAPYVGGPRTGPDASQAREMARRGWPSVQDVAKKLLPKHKPTIIKALRAKP